MSVSERLATASFDEKIHRFISLYCRGIVCPSESWHQIADVLERASVADLAAKLPSETIKLLRQCISERPESFDCVARLRPKLEMYRSIVET